MALRVTLLVLDLLPVVATSLTDISNSPRTLQSQSDNRQIACILPDSSDAVLAARQDYARQSSLRTQAIFRLDNAYFRGCRT